MVPGARLVRSRRMRLVLTGVNVTLVGLPDPVAHSIRALLTGTNAVPFQ